MPSLLTSGKIAALIGASRGWNFITSRSSMLPFASGSLSSVYASHRTASVARSAPADGSITCGMNRYFVDLVLRRIRLDPFLERVVAAVADLSPFQASSSK